MPNPEQFGPQTYPAFSQKGLLDYMGEGLDAYRDRGNPWFSRNHPSALAWKDIEEYKKTTGYDLSNDPDGYIASRLDEISGSVGVDSSGLGGGLLGTLKKVTPKYYQHKLLRDKEDLVKIKKEGFKPGIGGNVLPVYKGGKPTNVVDQKYGPKKGDVILLVPEDQVLHARSRSGGPPARVKEGYKPKEHEVVEIQYDFQSPLEAQQLKLMDVPKDPLIVQHNIHPKAIERADRIGGIPSPSVAISKADDPLTGFGDISLLGSPEMAIPSAKNPVYRGDGYTGRMPGVVIQPNEKAYNLVEKIYGDPISQSRYDVAELIGRYAIEGNTRGSKILEYNFLKSKGIKIKKPRKLNSKSPDNRIKNRENADIFEKEVREAFKKHTEEITGHPHNTNPQYLDWLGKQKSRIEKAGGRFDEKIFKGYTEMGNRRYAPATLENMIKEMKKGAGQESGFTASMGAVRAQVAPKFKSLPEIKKSRNKIVSKEDFNKAKHELDDEMEDIISDLRDMTYKHYGEKFGEPKTGGLHHTASATIDQLVEDLLVSTPRKSDYAEGLVDLIKPETIEKARALRQKMKGMPTEYFEAKPRRGVELSEFKGAIIPGHMDYSKNLKKILKKSGIKKVLEYGSDEERKQLFRKFPELMFGLLPPALVGGSLLED